MISRSKRFGARVRSLAFALLHKGWRLFGRFAVDAGLLRNEGILNPCTVESPKSALDFNVQVLGESCHNCINVTKFEMLSKNRQNVTHHKCYRTTYSRPALRRLKDLEVPQRGCIKLEVTYALPCLPCIPAQPPSQSDPHTRTKM